MIVLGIDPGTLAAGAAVLTATGNAPVLVTAERVTGRRSLDYEARVVAMTEELLEVAASTAPDLVRIEVPETHASAPRGPRKSFPSAAKYGYAAGYAVGVFRMAGYAVEAVGIVEASGGLTKAKRQAFVKHLFGAYDADRDPGRDVSDALYLAYQGLPPASTRKRKDT